MDDMDDMDDIYIVLDIDTPFFCDLAYMSAHCSARDIYDIYKSDDTDIIISYFENIA
jgi:hypothetical protein